MLLLSPRAAFFIWPETIAITLKPELSFFMLIDLCVYEIGKKKKNQKQSEILLGLDEAMMLQQRLKWVLKLLALDFNIIFSEH